MKKNILTKLLIVSIFVTSIFCEPSVKTEAAQSGNPVIVTIDPGHGGSENGASVNHNGKTVYEKNLNLKIAKYMKKELETYRNVKVYLTRSTDKTLSLDERVRIAANHSSDILYSIHNNAAGDSASYTDGACVLVSSGQYHKQLALAAQGIGKLALENIKKEAGIANRGYLKRLSGVRYYPNGQRADYYAIVRQGTEAGIPSLIMEHGFMTDRDDMNRLDSSSELKTLGIADAAAVAKYFGLSKKDGSVSYKKTGSRVRMVSRFWMLKDGKYYYVNSKEIILTGWQTISGSLYHFSSKGAASTGLKKIGSSYYYFNSKGKIQTGWKKIDKKWYYFKNNGKAYRNCVKKIGGKKYKFNQYAVCTNR